jgi:hypothetical protein
MLTHSQYCPQPTTITYSATTYPVTSPGTVTIPIVSCTTYPVTTGTIVPPPISPSYPVGTGAAPTVVTTSATNTPKSPSATTTGPAQVSAGAGTKVDAGFGALAAAGIAAFFL